MSTTFFIFFRLCFSQSLVSFSAMLGILYNHDIALEVDMKVRVTPITAFVEGSTVDEVHFVPILYCDLDVGTVLGTCGRDGS
jgi:hypothetical protein